MVNKKYLSLDVGLKRIGVAISLSAQIVTPITPIMRKNRIQASKEVKELLMKWEIDSLIVGIPIDSPDLDAMRSRIEHFVSLIEFNKEIIYQDESFSSFESAQLMRGVTKNKKDGKSDSISAMIILQRALNIIG